MAELKLLLKGLEPKVLGFNQYLLCKYNNNF